MRSGVLRRTVRTTDGADLAVQVSGPVDGPALLLLQGQANDHTWWTDLRRSFEDHWRCVTFDYRGTGATDAADAADAAWSTRGFADDAVAVLDALGVGTFSVYGTSMGGRVAQHVAAGRADRLERLVLAATTPGGPHAVERDRSVRLALSQPDAADRLRAMVDLFYTPAWGQNATRSHLLGDPSMTPRARQRHLAVSAGHDAWDLLPRIACTTLVLHGTDDRMAPAANAGLIAGRVPQADLSLVEGGRHGFFDEFAATVTAEVRRFLAG